MPPARDPSSPMPLAELQRWMLDAIVLPNRTDAASARTLAAARPAADVVLPSPTRSPEQRIHVYTEMFFLRLRDIFKGDFPGVHGLLGDDAFDDVVRDYLTLYPRRSYGLWDVGAALSNYFATHRDPPDQLLADMARLEFAIQCAIHVPESSVLTPQALGEIPPERFGEVRFRPANGFRVFAFDYDVNAMFNAINRGESVTDRSPSPAWAAVWRKDMTVWRQGLSRPMFEILAALIGGRAMGDAIEAGAACWEGDESELEAGIFQWFADWLGEGFFSAIVLPSD